MNAYYRKSKRESPNSGVMGLMTFVPFLFFDVFILQFVFILFLFSVPEDGPGGF